MTTPPDPNPTLIPPGDDVITSDEDLAAAAASALQGVTSPAVTPPMPIGTTWLFDFTAGRFVLSGGAPVMVSGLDALRMWIEMQLRVARFAHPVFSGKVGLERPDPGIGETTHGVREALADFERDLRPALRAHDRITDVIDFSASYDMTTGDIAASFTVVLDDNAALSVAGITIPHTGG